MSEIPSLKVVQFPLGDLVDIPARLRDLADAIEEGNFGSPVTCIVVLDTDRLFEVFGLGCEADGTVAHYLLTCAQRKIEAPFLKKMGVIE